MFKKVIAIMTASILAASMLVGCGLKKKQKLPQRTLAMQQQRQLAAISQTRKSASASISSLITS